LTAVIIGGVSLAGGRGTASRAFIGALVTVVLYQGFSLQGRGYDAYTAALAITLLGFATLDIKYGKNRDKAISKISVVPARLGLAPGDDVYERGSVWNPNARLTDAQLIGLGQVEGPEDVVVGARGELYCGDRRGWIWCFEGPDYSRGRVLSRPGGHPLGLAIDRENNVIVCIGGMGLYSISPDGTATPLATRVKRTRFRLRYDSAFRLPTTWTLPRTAGSSSATPAPGTTRASTSSSCSRHDRTGRSCATTRRPSRPPSW
jgi:ribose transport system permease protein